MKNVITTGPRSIHNGHELRYFDEKWCYADTGEPFTEETHRTQKPLTKPLFKIFDRKYGQWVGEENYHCPQYYFSINPDGSLVIWDNEAECLVGADYSENGLDADEYPWTGRFDVAIQTEFNSLNEIELKPIGEARIAFEVIDHVNAEKAFKRDEVVQFQEKGKHFWNDCIDHDFSESNNYRVRFNVAQWAQTTVKETTFVERIEIEKAELDKKITALSSFILSEKFSKLSELNQRLLDEQMTYMEVYSGVLEQRLSILKP